MASATFGGTASPPLISRRGYSGHTKCNLDDTQCRKGALLFLDTEGIERSLRRTVDLVNVALIVDRGTEPAGNGNYGVFPNRGVCLPTCLPNPFQIRPNCCVKQEASDAVATLHCASRLHYINNPEQAATEAKSLQAEDLLLPQLLLELQLLDQSEQLGGKGERLLSEPAMPEMLGLINGDVFGKTMRPLWMKGELGTTIIYLQGTNDARHQPCLWT